MPARRPEAILFDLWGTLLASDGFDPSRGNAALLRHYENPRGVALGRVNDLGHRVVAALEGREDQTALEFTQVSLFRIIADSLGLRLKGTQEEAEWSFWDAALQVRVIDGVMDLVAALEGLGIRMAVVSNSSFTCATLERELQRRGLLRFFAFVISSADYGVRKPDPIIFEIALARLGCPASRTWFAGDNVHYDIMGAMGAGLFPVAYNPRQPVPEGGAHLVVTRWSELVETLIAAEG